MSNRLPGIREVIKEKKLDALLVSSPENRRYLSGFTGSAGYLFITQQDAVLATDFRYVEQAGRQAPDYRVLRISSGLDWFTGLLEETKVKDLGFEADHMTVASHQRLTQKLKETPINGNTVNMAPLSGVADDLRTFKDPEELKLLQRAIDIADHAMDIVVPTLEPGVTEAEVAWRLEKSMREQGAEGPSFDTIVGSGPNGALPHHRAGERRLQRGEPIVIDMGAKYQGYCSDLTRTVIIGPPDDTFRKVYDFVLGAQLTATALVKPGVTGADCDGYARKVIEEAGYGETFGHSLGHGVGLAVHEYPGVGPTSQGILKQGMVFTIEPGIYISGWGGVRIEDIVLLEANGAKTLSKAKKIGKMGA
ncbi:MAG: aminopeptidase P family protein [Chloroflexi bacterium]|nr:aminopeptidase P family protein [Chloroflexota bacterium]